MKGLWHRLLPALLLALCCLAPAAAAAPLVVTQAEAVQGRWDDDVPPVDGWQPVSIPDVWAKRWPDYNGVVWYRLQWDQADANAPVGLLMEYLVMAGSVYVNGTLLHRDPHLTPPLSRAWNTPRYWLIAPPLLQAGRNTVLFRVAGAAAHQAGLGPLTLGPPAEVGPLYRHERLMRYDLQLISLTLCGNIVLFFGILWLMRHQDTVYGWFALTEAFWLLVGLNQVATSPWPFQSNDDWHALNAMAILGFAGCFAVFIWRFSGQRHPRLERALWIAVALGVLWLVGVPTHWLYPSRALLMVLSAAIVWTVCIMFMVTGWRSRQTDQRILAVCVSTFVITSAHDVLTFLRVLDSNIYYTSMTAHILMVGMALVLAWRFVNSLRRIEGFNLELQASVDAARSELASTLRRQHTLEVANARLSERVNLARDLHDGLGGALVGGIAAIEHEPEKASAPALLGLLKGMRDDLRLIVDSSAAHDGQGQPLAQLLVPLRHRFTTLLENSGIEVRWQLAGLDSLQLRPAQGLDVLRFLQEALTNVLKHSQSRSVEVGVVHDAAGLRVSVLDHGVGLPAGLAGEARDGVGLSSMRARAARLGGQLEVASQPGQTRVVLQVPLAAAPTA
ncbi:sensor histidine kinase [Variovorax terrae]|uniref:Histidine kinase n=1 Tax=Variovorax terrae TaxID=2923278 RepID=A0A9X2ALW0_9BURK|nr:7TM diverse intracellular signaling domain-containing protein [Variovorax terrae]MCJ0762080.1 histidine kinase [Variovorax terrae]